MRNKNFRDFFQNAMKILKAVSSKMRQFWSSLLLTTKILPDLNLFSLVPHIFQLMKDNFDVRW